MYTSSGHILFNVYINNTGHDAAETRHSGTCLGNTGQDGTQASRGHGRGINLYGTPKRHGAGRLECPNTHKILPCRCKPKTNGLDITCEKVSLSQIQASSRSLKEELKNRSSSEVTYDSLLSNQLGHNRH